MNIYIYNTIVVTMVSIYWILCEVATNSIQLRKCDGLAEYSAVTVNIVQYIPFHIYNCLYILPLSNSIT